MNSRGKNELKLGCHQQEINLYFSHYSYMILQYSFISSPCCHQSHSEPAVGAASAVPRRAADGASAAWL